MTLPITSAVRASVGQASFDVATVNEGPALLVVGVLAMLLAAAIMLRNPAAIAAWGFTVMLLVVSGLFGLGFEWVWLAVIATVVLVVLGAVVRWGGA